MNGVKLPKKAAADALHVANAILRPRIEEVCREGGYEPPLICTPTEFPPEGANNV